MESALIVPVGAIICLAGLGQSAVGFGYALFATPLLVWIGMPLPSVITLVATCSMIQSAIGVRSLRSSAPWRLALTASAVRTVSVVAGLLILKQLVVLSADRIRMVVGCILCAVVAIQLLWRPKPVATSHWGWAALAFVASGLLGGICGMGGPPLVLWAMAHNWSAEKTRGFLFAVFVMSIPVQLGLLALTFGAGILWNAAIGVAFAPLVFLGAAVGLPIGNRMAKDKLRRIAYVILFVIGASAVAPALLR